MAKLRVHNIESGPASSDVAFGIAGDTIAVSSDSLKLNTWKDSGGNTLFVSDGAGTLSSVNSGLSGAGPKLILSQTATGSASISFTANIDSTYDQYLFVFNDIGPATDNVVLQFQVSTNAGSSYGIAKISTMFDCYNRESAGDNNIYANTPGSLDNSTSAQPITRKQGNDADQSAAGTLSLYGPSSTTYIKNYIGRFQIYTNDDYSLDSFVAGFVNTTSAVNAIQFTMSSGNFDGTIKMYGVT